MYKVPLVFYGESTAEFENYYDFRDDKIDYYDEKKFNIKYTLGITAQDMHGMINKKKMTQSISETYYPTRIQIKRILKILD